MGSTSFNLHFHLAPLQGAVMTKDFSGGLRGPPTTGYFLATLRVALGRVNYMNALSRTGIKQQTKIVALANG